MGETYYPTWTATRAVPDEFFGEAYSALDGGRRAWVKKTIAQVHALSGSMVGPRIERSLSHRQGFTSRFVSEPLECAVLFLDETCTSASMTVAAAVPMLMSGVRNLCAVRVVEGEPEADDVLAALELAGLETVFNMNETDARKFMEFLVHEGSSAVLFQGQGDALVQLATAAGYASPPLRLWKPFVVDSVAVWAGAGGEWDWDILSWVHPCAQIDVFGARTAIPELPPGSKRVRGGFEVMLDAGYPALYVPEARLPETAGRARLVLAHGQEGCWAWPGLGTRFFRPGCLALGEWNR